MVEKHIKRFKEDRDYLVKQNIKNWIRDNRIQVISVEIREGTRKRMSADVTYKMEK